MFIEDDLAHKGPYPVETLRAFVGITQKLKTIDNAIGPPALHARRRGSDHALPAQHRPDAELADGEMEIRIFEGARHSIYNEINRDEVYGVLLAFLGRIATRLREARRGDRCERIADHQKLRHGRRSGRELGLLRRGDPERPDRRDHRLRGRPRPGWLARTIDAAGAFVVPGLVNMHEHLSFAHPRSSESAAMEGESALERVLRMAGSARRGLGAG